MFCIFPLGARYLLLLHRLLDRVEGAQQGFKFRSFSFIPVEIGKSHEINKISKKKTKKCSDLNW
jgi:hypothetical protein